MTWNGKIAQPSYIQMCQEFDIKAILRNQVTHVQLDKEIQRNRLISSDLGHIYNVFRGVNWWPWYNKVKVIHDWIHLEFGDRVIISYCVHKSYLWYFLRCDAVTLKVGQGHPSHKAFKSHCAHRTVMQLYIHPIHTEQSTTKPATGRQIRAGDKNSAYIHFQIYPSIHP